MRTPHNNLTAIPYLLLALVLGSGCTHISKAPGGWLARHAPMYMGHAPWGRFEHRDLTWDIIGIEKIPEKERAKFVEEVIAAIDLWGSVEAAKLVFTRGDGEGADIRIYLDDSDFWVQQNLHGVMALAWTPDTPYRGMIRLRYDGYGRDNLKVGVALRGNPQVVPNRWGFRPMEGAVGLRGLVAHEVGHALGIGRHDWHPAALMHARGARGRPELDVRDAGSLVALYGWEPWGDEIFDLRSPQNRGYLRDRYLEDIRGWGAGHRPRP
jgi:hypothetical protein